VNIFSPPPPTPTRINKFMGEVKRVQLPIRINNFKDGNSLYKLLERN